MQVVEAVSEILRQQGINPRRTSAHEVQEAFKDFNAMLEKAKEVEEAAPSLLPQYWGHRDSLLSLVKARQTDDKLTEEAAAKTLDFLIHEYTTGGAAGSDLMLDKFMKAAKEQSAALRSEQRFWCSTKRIITACSIVSVLLGDNEAADAAEMLPAVGEIDGGGVGIPAVEVEVLPVPLTMG